MHLVGWTVIILFKYIQSFMIYSPLNLEVSTTYEIHLMTWHTNIYMNDIDLDLINYLQ